MPNISTRVQWESINGNISDVVEKYGRIFGVVGSIYNMSF